MSASGRPSEQSPANQDAIRFGEPYAYESASGRPEWLSRDPIEEEGGLNLYGYVGNNPINVWDPFGFCEYPADFIGPLNMGDTYKQKPGWLQWLERFESLFPQNHFDTLQFNAAGTVPVKTRELPTLDSTGKVHGDLPHPKDLSKYSADELRQLKSELEQSVKERIRKTSEIGPDRAHGQRQGAEQDLIKAIDKYLSGS